jgi:hypothetical protein
MQARDRNEETRSERPVDVRSDRASLSAEVDAPGATESTPPARREIGLARHARPEPRLVQVGTDLHDDPGDLMTHRHRRDRLILAVCDVEIGAADPRSEHLDHHLTSPDERLRPLDEGDVPHAGSELGEADHSEPETRA